MLFIIILEPIKRDKDRVVNKEEVSLSIEYTINDPEFAGLETNCNSSLVCIGVLVAIHVALIIIELIYVLVKGI